jgi:hypothetical protein
VYPDVSEELVLVCDTFVRTVGPDRDPLGQCFTIGLAYSRPSGPPPCRRVIGVFGDFARVGIRDKGTIAVAVPSRPGRRSMQALVVRTTTPAPASFATSTPATSTSAKSTSATSAAASSTSATSASASTADANGDPEVVAPLLRETSRTGRTSQRRRADAPKASTDENASSNEIRMIPVQ